MKPIRLKSFLCLLLAILSAFSLMGCQGGEGEGNPTSSDTGTQAPAAETFLDLVVSGKTEYKIIYPEGASRDVMQAVSKLQDTIKTYTGAKIRDDDDFLGHQDKVEPYEILVGNTNRDESQKHLQGMRYGEYTIAVEGTKLVLAAASDNAVTSAVNMFIKNVIRKDESLYKGCKDGTFRLSSTYYLHQTGVFSINSCTVNGINLAQSRLIVPNKGALEYYFAKLIMLHLRTYTGYILPIVTDEDVASTSGGDILIGDTRFTTVSAPADSYRVEVTAKGVEIVSDSAYGYPEAYSCVCQRIFPGKSELNLTAGLSYTGEDYHPDDLEHIGDLRIMYHNIWGTLSDDERSYLGDRNALAKASYQAYAPDILCLQEASAKYRGADKVLFNWLRSEYTEIFYSGSNAIYYKEDVVELVEKGFSNETPYDNGCVWAVFRLRADGTMFAVINVHFPSNWYSTDSEVTNHNRVLAAKNSVNALQSIRSKHPGIPVFHGGDYNTAVGTGPFLALNAAGLTNVRLLCSDVTEAGTCRGGTQKPQYMDEYDLFLLNNSVPADVRGAIDHITALGDSFEIHRYHLLTDMIALTSSDHIAHFIDVSFK